MRTLASIRDRGTAGFTLLELLMVLCIMGVILSISIVQWPQYISSTDSEIEAKKIAAKIREVQQMAILQEKSFRIVFDQLGWGAGYRIERFEGSDSWSVQSRFECPQKVCVTIDSGLPFQGPGTPSPNKTDPQGDVLTFDQFGGVLLAAPANRKEAVISFASLIGTIEYLHISNYTGIVSLHE